MRKVSKLSAGSADHLPWESGGMSNSTSIRAALVTLGLGGLALASTSFGPWGVGHQGFQPTVTGLGKVSVSGASAADVAFLQAYTGRPGLVTLLLGVAIVVAAGLAWWRAELRIVGSSVALLAAGGALTWALVVLSAPEDKLFDAAVNEAVGADGSVLSVGWALWATVVVSVICVVAGLAVVGRGVIARSVVERGVSRSVESS